MKNSPYLDRQLRSEAEVRRQREEQGRTATGAWLPWERDDEGPMYLDLCRKIRETIK